MGNLLCPTVSHREELLLLFDFTGEARSFTLQAYPDCQVETIGQCSIVKHRSDEDTWWVIDMSQWNDGADQPTLVARVGMMKMWVRRVFLYTKKPYCVNYVEQLEQVRRLCVASHLNCTISKFASF